MARPVGGFPGWKRGNPQNNGAATVSRDGPGTSINYGLA